MPIANFCLLFQREKELLCLNTISSIIRKSTHFRKAMQNLYKHLFFFPNGFCPHLVSRTSLCKGTDKHTDCKRLFLAPPSGCGYQDGSTRYGGAVTESRGDTDGHIGCTSSSRARRMPLGDFLGGKEVSFPKSTLLAVCAAAAALWTAAKHLRGCLQALQCPSAAAPASTQCLPWQTPRATCDLNLVLHICFVCKRQK